MNYSDSIKAILLAAINDLSVKNVNVQKNMLTNHKGSDIVRMYKIIHRKS